MSMCRRRKRLLFAATVLSLLGSSAQLARMAGPQTRVIDLGGRLAIPGFIEGHGHFTGIGEFRLEPESARGSDLG